MRAELNLVAMALVLEDHAVPVDVEDFTAPWLARCWEVLKRGGGMAAMFAQCSASQVVMLSDAIDALPPVKHNLDMQEYARVVKEGALDRQIRTVCEGHHGSTLHHALFDLMSRRQDTAVETSTPVKDIVPSIVAECEAVREGDDPISGVTTGLTGVDGNLTFGGLLRGAVTVLAGERSSGKSALAKTCVLGAAGAGQSVWWGSFEDSREAATTRMLSDLSDIENRQLQRRIVGPTEWKHLVAAAGHLSRGDIRIWDKPVGNVGALCQLITSEVRRYGVDLVVIDYLQLLRMTDGNSKTEMVGNAANTIANTARALGDVAFLMVSQLKRLHGARPSMDDLRWAGEIEQAADTIGLLWKPEIDFPGHVCLDIVKQKNGAVGLVPLAWRPETVSYRDPDEYAARSYLEAIGNIGGKK